MGDATAAASYAFYSGSGGDFGVGLTGRVKFATARKGLGSGANDYAAQLDAYQRFGNYAIMGSLGYEVLGNPAGIDTNNVAYGILGGSLQSAGQTTYGAEIRLAQKPSVIDAEQRELIVYGNHRVSERVNIRAYVLKGFSDGSPDSGFGLLVSNVL